MTVRWLIELACDVCGATYGSRLVPERNRYGMILRALRLRAIKEGWVSNVGAYGRKHDRCPRCAFREAAG